MDVQTYFFRRKNINAAGNARSWTDHLLWHHAAHTVDLFQYQAGETISDCYAVQGPIHPQLNIAMDMGIVARTPSGAILTLSLSFNNDGPLGSFFRYICDNGTYKAFYDDLSDGKDNKIDVSKVDVSMDGIELEDREFIAAIKEKREPNASLAQVLPCMHVLGKLEKDHRSAAQGARVNSLPCGEVGWSEVRANVDVTSRHLIPIPSPQGGRSSKPHSTIPISFARRSASARSGFGIAVVDDAALVEDHGARREGERDAAVLLDQDDRQRAFGAQFCQHVDQRVDEHRRQAFGRLVHQEDFGIGQKRARDRQHLLLAAGELIAHIAEPLLRVLGNSANTRGSVQWPGRAPMSRFSRTVSEGKISRSCGTKPRPASARR